MRKIIWYLYSLIRNVILNIFTFGSYRAGLLSCCEHVYVRLYKGGKITIGDYTQNRDKLYLICDSGKMEIGKHCFFNTNCSVTCLEHIKIGDGCTFGNNVVIVDHDHDYQNPIRGKFVTGSVTIGKNVWVGANCVILKDTVIGDNCVIAAGAIVKGKIPESTVYYGKNKK